MGRTPKHSKPNLKQLLPVSLFLVALYVVLPQIGSFRSSWQLLGHPNLGWVAGAIAFTGLTYMAAAGTYCLLAFKRLRYRLTLLLQLAAMFVNRLLPGGVGALGVNYLYLRRSGHSAAQAGSLVAVNNLLGFVGHSLLVALAFVVYNGPLPTAKPLTSFYPTLRWLALGVLILGLVLLVMGHSRALRFGRDLARQLVAYSRRPWRVVGALCNSMALTLAHTLSIYCCCRALGLELSLAAILLVLAFAVAAGTAIPTPGGLGTYEAAVVAGLVAYRIDSALALAIALLYRFISYWLALAVGALAFIYAERRQLLEL